MNGISDSTLPLSQLSHFKHFKNMLKFYGERFLAPHPTPKLEDHPLFGVCDWSLTLREEHRLRVFENRVLRKVFGHKREEGGSWRKLHNDELHGLYSSLNIVRMIK
jgi:hypothetical protein